MPAPGTVDNSVEVRGLANMGLQKKHVRVRVRQGEGVGVRCNEDCNTSMYERPVYLVVSQHRGTPKYYNSYYGGPTPNSWSTLRSVLPVTIPLAAGRTRVQVLHAPRKGTTCLGPTTTAEIAKTQTFHATSVINP